MAFWPLGSGGNGGHSGKKTAENIIGGNNRQRHAGEGWVTSGGGRNDAVSSQIEIIKSPDPRSG